MNASSSLVKLAATMALGLGLLSGAQATPPPAGTSIGNQASVTYTDGSGTSRTVTSNTVQTIVQQVASLSLTAPSTKTASVGSTVYYPQTLTNSGNGTDTFTLAAVNAAGVTFSMTGITLYADNGSGQPTGPAITSTGALASGASFKFIVAGTVPTTATAAQTNTLTVTATSTLTATVTQSLNDVTTVTANAVITLTKAVSVSTGAPGSGPYTYTLTYTNTGNSTATSVKITDAIPAGLTEVANSGLWSVTGVTALNDTSGATYGTAPNTLTYSFAAGTVTATLASVAPGVSGTISFKVNVAGTAPPGVINNTAAVGYVDGGGNTIPPANSNVVAFTVSQTAAVSLTGATVPSANPGSSAAFTNIITNKGTGTDTFNITLSAGNFPSGTSFVLYKSDGVTPLIDTNGDGIPDTGPMAAGAVYNVVVKAVLPANAAGTGPFTVNKIATSTLTPTVSATAADTLTALTAATVDLTGNAPLGGSGVKGVGAGPEAAAQVVSTTNPNTSTTFILVANNTGPIADTYNLGASTASNFASTTLPAGWTVTFKADGGGGTCATTGATLNNTGTVNAGANATFCAVVSIPAGFAAGTTDLYFRTLSPATGAQDTLHDSVVVGAVHSLTFTPNNTGQTYPSGSVVYSHTLTNTGNVVAGNGSPYTITLPAANTQTGWTAVQYYDANNNGVLDATDPVVPATGLQVVLPGGLAAGQSITIFDKITAPSGVSVGVVNTTTITLTVSNGATTYAAATTTDSTTVIAGNVTIVKAQGVDPACTGTPAGGYVMTTVSTGAVPGACIDYQITVTNAGSANATAVTVSDATPTYTTLSTAPVVTVGTITPPTPAAGSAGTVTATVGTLTPGQSAVLTFGVKIQQ